MMDFDAIRQQVLQPVTALNPVGSDCRLEEAFDHLKTAMQGMDSLESEVEPDWQHLLEQSLQLFATRSKDSLVLCWLAYAMGRVDRLSGVVNACLLVGEVVAAFGDALLPGRKRKRAVVLAFGWLAQKWLADHEQEQASLPVTEVCVAQCKVVSEWLAALDAPADHEWYRWFAMVQAAHKARMERAVRAASQTAPTLGEAEAAEHRANASVQSPTSPGQSEKSAPLAQAPVVGGIDSAEGLVKAQRAGMAFVESYCQYLRQRKINDPMPYQLSRSFAFGGVVQLPPSREGQTELRPIPDEKRIRLDQLKSDQDWPAYIDELERSLFRLPFWLTGHRHVAEALRQTGSEGESAARLLQSVCRAWVERYKALESLRFRDDTPFADAATLDWLSQAGAMQVAPSGRSSVTLAEEDGAENLDDSELAGMNLVDALAALAERASRLPTPLQRLHSWLRQGELARERGKHKLAAAIGRGVMKQLETHSAGQFLLNERLQALELVAQTSQDISPELAELSLYQPQVAYRLINQSK